VFAKTVKEPEPHAEWKKEEAGEDRYAQAEEASSQGSPQKEKEVSLDDESGR
jgi:hypothetical protein